MLLLTSWGLDCEGLLVRARSRCVLLRWRRGLKSARGLSEAVGGRSVERCNKDMVTVVSQK